jgi:Tfp pilus assembly protein PilO
MIANLSKRERLMATAVGSVFVIVINFILIRYFLQNQGRLAFEFRQKTVQLDGMKKMLADKPIWEQRAAWLKEKQPKLTNEATAGGELLEEVRKIAQKNNVQPLDPQIGTAERQPQYVAVGVTIDIKGTYEALRDFLKEMQAPDRFIVFKSANLQIDKEDKTKMHAHFIIQRWFAPK